MRLLIAAVGRLKQGPERDLAAAYHKRAEATGRSLGLRGIEVVEIRESRAQDVERRRVEESIALANVIPDGAIVVVLEPARRKRLDSPALAGSLLPQSGGRRIGRPHALSSAAPTAWRRA